MSDSKLGFTFYPKDWWTSDSFYAMQPFERYIYLELLFMMYANEGCVVNNKLIVERRLATVIKDEVWQKVTDLMVKDGDQLTHKSVNKRLSKTLANRENGKLGGRPKKYESIENIEEFTESEKEITQITQINNPKKPTLEYKEKENINKKEREVKKATEVAIPQSNLKNTLPKRKLDFGRELKAFVKPTGPYPPEMVRKFYDYWTEQNKSATKMKYELERTFETAKRLATWANRDNEWSKPNSTNTVNQPTNNATNQYDTTRYQG
jgi:hypothetical protein